MCVQKRNKMENINMNKILIKPDGMASLPSASRSLGQGGNDQT